MSGCDVRVRELKVGDYERVRNMIISGLREPTARTMKAQLMDRASIWGIIFGLAAVVGFVTSIDVRTLAVISFLPVFMFYVSGFLYLNHYNLPMELEDFHSSCPIDRYENFWVAEVRSAGRHEIVGSVALRRMDEYKLELKRMSVDKKYRRKGVASLLLRKALDHCTDEDAKEVVLSLSCERILAIHLYSRFGFRPRRVYMETSMFGLLHISHMEMSHTRQ